MILQLYLEVKTQLHFGCPKPVIFCGVASPNTPLFCHPLLTHSSLVTIQSQIWQGCNPHTASTYWHTTVMCLF